MQLQRLSRLLRLRDTHSARSPRIQSRLPGTVYNTRSLHKVARASPRLLSTSVRRHLATIAPTSTTTGQFDTSSFMAGQKSADDFAKAEDGQYYVYKAPIEKAFSDDRSYRLIRLPNDLEVLLIHDAETDKASAALDVHVGHLSDPHNMQGLAHFCEHLLFMGTKKYPKENAYNQYLSEHSGHSNAFTGLDETNYFFEVGHEHFEGALDRFSQFFIAPLFDPSCTDRELRAVDSEHKKNLQEDMWRMFQLEKSLSNPQHPYSNFGTGNMKSLREDPEKLGLHPRDELLKWHADYYSANIMKLVVLGRESLDELTKMVVDKFHAVPNKGREVPSYPGKPLTPKELGVEVYCKPVKDVRGLELTFSFPDHQPLFRSNPGRYLSHLIGHEGPGSILSLLKKKGWANYLSAGLSHGSVGFDFFKIHTDLTEEGLAHYKEVLAIIFQYIRLLKDSGPSEQIFREVELLNEVAFRFQEKSSASKYTSALAGAMQKPYPREWILSGPWLLREYNTKELIDSMQHLSIDNFKVTVTSQEFPGSWQNKERWYGTEYTIEPIDAKLRKILEEAPIDKELHLPKPNAFVPEDFETHKREVSKASKRPFLIKHSPETRLWHKKDDTFWLPKACFFIQFYSPMVNNSAKNAVMTRLYTDIIRDALNEYSYDAEMAGIGYSLNERADGVQLIMDGYNDKMPVLLEKILTKMKTLQIDEDRFAKIKELLKRAYKNWNLEPPYQHAMYYVSYVTELRKWSMKEKAAALEETTLQDVQNFFPSLLSNLRVETMIHGNVFKEDAVQIASKAQEIIQPEPLSAEAAEEAQVKSLRLPEGTKVIIERQAFDPNEMNSGIEYFVPVCQAMDHELRAKLSLLTQITNEPCFDQLRTKEQLGYLVFSGPRQLTSSYGMRFIIQSERDAVHLENRIEAFLLQLDEILAKMTDEEFKQHASSLIARKKEKPKNLWQEGSRYWSQITSGYYHFEQDEVDISNVEKLTKEDLREFFKQYIHPSSPTRSKLSVHVRSHASDNKAATPAEPPKETADGEKVEVVVPDQLDIPKGNTILKTDEDIVAFKSKLEVEPAPAPVKEWNDFLTKL